MSRSQPIYNSNGQLDAKTMLEQAMGVHGIPEAIHADGVAQ